MAAMPPADSNTPAPEQPFWVRWRYMDHGHPDWAELEIPAGEDPVDYICERRLVPTWAERFSPDRVKVSPIEQPARETVLGLIKATTRRLASEQDELVRYVQLLMTLPQSEPVKIYQTDGCDSPLLRKPD